MANYLMINRIYPGTEGKDGCNQAPEGKAGYVQSVKEGAG